MPTSSSKKHVAICEQDYVTNKDIAEERQTVKVMTAMKDPHWEDWVEVHYDELKALTLKAFLTKFKDNFMPANWETDVCIELNVMSQNDHQSFHNFAIAVQNKNGLLKNTESHLNTMHLCTCIEAGMDPTLNKWSCQSDKKFHLIIDLQPWIEAVKELDDMLQMDCTEHRAEMEAAQRASHQRTQDDHPLAEPSRKANISSTGSSNYSNPARKDWPPKLTHEEGDLLLNNHGCSKCRKLYVFHTKNDNKCDFPKGSGYKPVTQTIVDIAHCEHDTKKKHPVAAIPSISSSTSDVTPHPVAAVMGFASNPAGYTAANTSNVLSDDKEDELHSNVRTCNALIKSIEDPEATPPKADESQAPLTMPHLFWHASYSPPIFC